MARRKKLPCEPFEAEVRELLENGRGALVHEDRSLELYGGLPGEAVMARHLFARRMRGRAEAVEVLRASPDRVPPRCPHFGVCGACTLQHMNPGAQLAFKEDILLTHLAQEGGVTPEVVLPPLEAGAWHYRRRARLSVRHVKGKGRVLVGFRERDGRFVADLSECHVLYKPVADRLTELSALVGALDAFESIPQIEVCCGDSLCALVLRHLEPLSDKDSARLREFARASGLAIALQPGGAGTVHALEPERPLLDYAVPEFGLVYRFEPLDFVQVHGGLNRLMIRQALNLLRPGPGEHALELFSGLGNFTLPLAKNCARVTGMEGDAGLVCRARENARRNGVENAEFVHADLYGGAASADRVQGSFDLVLLDPPRSGAEDLLAPVSDTGAARILYVSCNPATLGRDAGILVRQHGFRLKAAGVMDMFPHTVHVESMASFERS